MDQKNKEMRTDAKRDTTGTEDQADSYHNGPSDGEAYEMETLESLRREAEMKQNYIAQIQQTLQTKFE